MSDRDPHRSTPEPSGEREGLSHYRAVSPAARRGTLIAVGVVLLAVFGVGGAVVLGLSGGDDPAAPSKATATSVTEGAETGAQPRELDQRTAEDQLGSGHVALRVTRTQLLRTRPDPKGQLVGRATSRTPYGGPTILPIVKAYGDWVAVVSPYRRNNKIAWTKVDQDARYAAVEYSISIRLSKRTIVVRRNGIVIRRYKSAVGQVTHPTPPGRYAVTDGLIFSKESRGPYGCCALVLSARQYELPAGWTGGDRIAIHGTPNKDSIGLAASLGCLRVGDEASRWLVNKIPAGTTVIVRP